MGEARVICDGGRWVHGPSRFYLTSIYSSKRWGDIVEDGRSTTATLTVTGRLQDDAFAFTPTTASPTPTPTPTTVRYRFTRSGTVLAPVPDQNMEWAMFTLGPTSSLSTVYLYRVNTAGAPPPPRQACTAGTERADRVTAEYWAYEKPTTVNTLWVKDNPRLCQP